MFQKIVGWALQRRVYACLCHARADEKNAYPFREKHALLAMVRSSESTLLTVVCQLLSENGWTSVELLRAKKLDLPFASDDPAMISAHEAAAEGRGGIIVYQDAIPD
jgi:hypothetical protein